MSKQASSQTFFYGGSQIGQILGPFYDYAWIILRSHWNFWGGRGGGFS